MRRTLAPAAAIASDRRARDANPGDRAQPARVATGDPTTFSINGRFQTQATTGVQRYAREIIRALDALLSAEGTTAARLLVPAGHASLPAMGAIGVESVMPLTGHTWEQVVLPFHASGPLLNLCNTAPLAHGRQIVCMHDANVFLEPDSYSRGFRWTYQVLLPMLARTGARITTVSDSAARDLSRALPIDRDAITVLSNGHEHVWRWSAARSTVLSEQPPTNPYVLLLGSRAKHKNMTLVLGLADRLAECGIDLYVAGGTGAVFAEVTAVSHRNVRWLGRVSDDDLAALFGQALCLAFPSLTEGFGLPVLEAMALGCPVVSSDRASLPELCGQAALVADPTDPRAWLDHLLALSGSETLRDDLRGRGRAQAQRFSWKDSALGYLNLIKEMSDYY